MIKVLVIEASADGRRLLSDRLTSLLCSAESEGQFLPRVSIQTKSVQEVRFTAGPDICVLGAQLVSDDIACIAEIREAFGTTAILVALDRKLNNLSTIEQLIRHGADDILSLEMMGEELVRKIIVLTRRTPKCSPGKLILVDGGKGGIGVSSVAAALGEGALQNGATTVLVDLDFETQDLSRFIQARPFINENLRLILDQERPVNDESVAQCLAKAWGTEEELLCMTPVPPKDEMYGDGVACAQALHGVLEVLDANYKNVIVDLAGVTGALRRMLYRVADRVVFVVSNDPAAFFASVEKLHNLRSIMGVGGELKVVFNSNTAHGLKNRDLLPEFSRAARLKEGECFHSEIAFSLAASRWPGSGRTVYSLGPSSLRKGLDKLLLEMGLVECQRSERKWISAICGVVPELPIIGNKAVAEIRATPTFLPSEPRKALPEPSPRLGTLEQVTGSKRVEELGLEKVRPSGATEEWWNEVAAEKLIGVPRVKRARVA